MRTDEAPVIRLADYRAPDYLIETVDLDVSLHPTATRVKSLLRVAPNPHGRAGAPLVLDGDDLTCVAARLDGTPLDVAAVATPSSFTLEAPPQRAFSLEIETQLDPSANTRLMGLYRSNGVWCTQCEADGFRRIAYFLDRPDVMSVFTTRIEAKKSEAPVLLGNGDLVASGDCALASRHFAVWFDPHPKPAYLFALVGGDLEAVRDRFVTMSGRDVSLGVYVEHGKADRAAYAMDALKRSMAWDERVFGREYDLDVFNIVAVSDFNMGAMENKGLNIFNDKYVLASPQTATDSDYAGVESVVAHEYFHNWTGNRITCRDWFQLCLKEGLTVFRDQEFSSDERSRPVKRVADVKQLRAAQFPEDAGPLAHPVRPQAYREINNFYTPTVYEKGAEVIRMLQTLIGLDAFRRGMDLYFSRYDGTAATVEQFISCFADASGRDLAHFMLWYDQAGTPTLTVTTHHDAAARRFTVTLKQETTPTPGQPIKSPLVLPVRLGLVGDDGDLPLVSKDATAEELAQGVFTLDQARRRIVFENVTARPALSALRGFSAPVRLIDDADDADLLKRVARDPDSFNRWEATQRLATRRMIASTQALRSGGGAAPANDIADALDAMLAAAQAGRIDLAGAAQMLALPSEMDVARDIGADVDPDAVRGAREAMREVLGRALRDRLVALHDGLASSRPFSPDAAAAGRRALRNVALDLLIAGDPEQGETRALRQQREADNMTDEIAALAALTQRKAHRDAALDMFLQRHRDNPLLVDKWLAIQASVADATIIERIESVTRHDAFSWSNPNRVRSLFATFAMANPSQFHRADGAGYRLLAETAVRVDAANPQLAARLLTGFKNWRAMESGRRAKAQAALRALDSREGLSRDAADIVGRSLA
jgi:aminopeptidase N